MSPVLGPDFEPHAIERRARDAWQAGDVYRVAPDPTREKFYACSMLPYPSGRLHMGHVRNYTINDMMARQLRRTGKNVLMPMGWDAFGLPAENAAMKNGVPPARWTRDNIAAMKAQMVALGLAIDWSREIATCDPSYYRWNQWLFLKMVEQGIAVRRTQVVNWDPVDQTVLANEQVVEGRGWRSGAVVEKREIPGWYLTITRYAEELLEAVQGDLAGWPERVKTMQANWIGKSRGVRFAFPHAIPDPASADGGAIGGGRLHVFTTRADTVMGVSFVAVAPEHPIALAAATRDPALADFVARCRQGGTTEAEVATREQLGMATGFTVLHPLTHEPVPVWVANYVLMGYGDGAVMGVPAHDARDWQFAKRYGLAISQVIHVDGERFTWDHWQDWYARTEGAVTINSDVYSGLDHDAAVDAVARTLAERGLGGLQTTWRLRDWGISRQRYWGTPIPMIHCAACGVVPVPEADLPVVLPEGLVPDGSGNPLAGCAAFVDVACPRCGAPSKRETDTMDTFVDSAWYVMRYCDPHLETAMVGEGARHWLPVDQYIGGIEHAILHLLYARFWTRVMRDCGLVAIDEPFTRLLTQGMVLNHVWARQTAAGGVDYFPPAEVTDDRDGTGHLADGSKVEYRGMLKMGKTERNGVDPQDLIDRYGADTARLFVMFASPPEQTLDWNDAGVEGASRFLRRLWKFAAKHAEAVRGAVGKASKRPAMGPVAALRRELHSTLRQIQYDYERLQYNTVVSGAMKLLNALEAHAAASPGGQPNAAVLAEGLEILVGVLDPVCPHIGFVLWQELGFEALRGPLLDAPWPEVDIEALATAEIELVLQVNGKTRGSMRAAPDIETSAIEAAALASPEVQKFVAGQAVKRVVVVPGRLVNIVVG